MGEALQWNSGGRCLQSATTAGVLFVMVAVFSSMVTAADLTVQVHEKGSRQIVEDASVCLGTTANPSQFGAYRTGLEGAVSFDNLPRHGHLLTVSKPGYLGISRLVDALGTEQILAIGLARGGGGPTCSAARSLEVAPQEESAGLRVERLRLNGGVRSTRDRLVRLEPQLNAEVTHYRVSESANFSGSAWLDYVAQPSYTLSEGSGFKRVYFQVRRYHALGESSLETVSPVVSATIRLE